MAALRQKRGQIHFSGWRVSPGKCADLLAVNRDLPDRRYSFAAFTPQGCINAMIA
ncbi:MAG: hypothetical protein ACK4GM_10330 [Tabrizicola sp.]